MDNPGLGSEMLSVRSARIFDLESPLPRSQNSVLCHSSMPLHHHMTSMADLDNNRCHDSMGMGPMETKCCTPRATSMKISKGNTSEDDEPSYAEDGLKGQKAPWQRMKWTDNVVRLLIAVVSCVGDDGSFEGIEGLKRKSGLFLQKKGKWKTVSKIMMSRGCHVSPQQCEDKFNDLNKRYKRLNEILGRGTSSQVVENPSLMDSMPHLTSKMKDIVGKILSSKHLFYQEICAYHNGQKMPDFHDIDLHGYTLPTIGGSRDTDGSEEEDEEEEEERNNECDMVGLDNEDENLVLEDTGKMREYHEEKQMHEDGHLLLQSDSLDSFKAEMAGVFRDPTKTFSEQRAWIENRILQLQEQRINYLAVGLELEKRHFKWQRFCSKKNRELERSRLENEREKLETRRMELMLKQKELEIDFKR